MIGAAQATLLDIRDEVDSAKELVVALWLASQLPLLPREARGALCAVADAARQKLANISAALGNVIEADRNHAS